MQILKIINYPWLQKHEGVSSGLEMGVQERIEICNCFFMKFIFFFENFFMNFEIFWWCFEIFWWNFEIFEKMKFLYGI